YTLGFGRPFFFFFGLGLCWIVKIAASAQLVRFAWGRRTIGRWLLAFALLLLHVEVAGVSHPIVGYDVLVDLLLGIGIMTIVLEDSRVQIQRLDALNTITHQISDSRDFDSTVNTILDEIIGITHAKAVWFRTLQGDKLVMTASKGLSESFVQNVPS